MTSATSPAGTPTRWQLVLAFFAIYVLWGSSYVFIHFAVESIPPFFMSATRFLTAGAVMYAWARLRGSPAPSRAHWRSALLASLPVFLINNGALVWASQTVPSSTISLIIAVTPMWMVLLDWWRPGGVRPSGTVIGGLFLGLLGIALLLNPDQAADGPANVPGMMVVLVGTVGWAVGSVYTRHCAQPASPILTTGMQLLMGGASLLMLGLVTGEGARFDPASITPLSLLSLAWLTVMGSIIGFGCYIWLLRVSTPARVATYAYVNPLVAVVLGWALAGEPITVWTLVAAAIIVGAVMLVNGTRYRGISRPRLRLAGTVGRSI